jgi:hypothetical protein
MTRKGAFIVMKMQKFVFVLLAFLCLNLSLEKAAASTIVFSDTFFPPSPTPLQIPGVMAANAGSAFVLVLLSNGQVTNIVDNKYYPAMNPPAGLSNVIAISAVTGDALALTKEGTVVAWGGNIYGETNVPKGLSNVVAISAGYGQELALRSDGTVASWGQSSNLFNGLSNVVALACGAGFFALEANGTVVSSEAANAPPPGLTNVIAISCGQYEPGTLALLTDGSVVGWDNNSVLTKPLPADVTNTVAISGDLETFLALQADGSVVVGGKPPLISFPTSLSNAYIVSASDYEGEGLVVEEAGWPFFTVQPGSQTTGTGGTIYLHARVVVSTSVSYQWQWQLNGTDLPGVTNSDLIISSAAVTNAGKYQALVSFNNGFNWATSSLATVTVLPPPVQIPTLLTAPIAQSDGSFMLTAKTTNGQPFLLTNAALFILQASSDLLNWTPLTNISPLANGAIDFFDSGATSSPARFYRLLKP